ncbi:MAG: hypothetical protein ABI574_00895 [Burkholderiales bacterium]
MSRRIDEGAVRQAVESLTRDCQAYAGSDSHRPLLGLLDALAEAYKLDLMEVRPEGLLHVQAALKQVVALRDSISTPGAPPPRI